MPRVCGPGAGPPMRALPSGRAACRQWPTRTSGAGGEPQVAGGSSSSGPPARRKWWNAGSDELHTTGWCARPAMSSISQLAVRIDEGERRPSGVSTWHSLRRAIDRNSPCSRSRLSRASRHRSSTSSACLENTRNAGTRRRRARSMISSVARQVQGLRAMASPAGWAERSGAVTAQPERGKANAAVKRRCGGARYFRQVARVIPGRRPSEDRRDPGPV